MTCCSWSSHSSLHQLWRAVSSLQRQVQHVWHQPICAVASLPHVHAGLLYAGLLARVSFDCLCQTRCSCALVAQDVL